jgi:tRNA 2-selenouridine synthase
VETDARLSRILEQYGQFPASWLLECTKKLAKRLGGERVTMICSYIESGLIQEAAKELMIYYDATYDHGLRSKLRPVHTATEETFLSVASALTSEQ